MYSKNIKTEVIYLDDDDHIIDKEKATKIIIRICDKNGNLLSEKFMYKINKEENANKRTYGLSQE